MSEPSYALFLSLFLGARHALEPDHLAALSTMLTTAPKRPAALGIFWGAGHALALCAVATVLALLERELPPAWSSRAELLVALLLVFLGVRTVWLVWAAFWQGRQGVCRLHHHGDARHRHLGPEKHVHVGSLTLAQQPLLVGLLHGLAGSGALSALCAAQMPTVPLRILYAALFGLGAMLAMGAVLGVLGQSFCRLISTRPAITQVLTLVAGLLSLVLGLFWGFPHLLGLFHD